VPLASYDFDCDDISVMVQVVGIDVTGLTETATAGAVSHTVNERITCFVK
jgi:hypothetical protein